MFCGYKRDRYRRANLRRNRNNRRFFATPRGRIKIIQCSHHTKETAIAFGCVQFFFLGESSHLTASWRLCIYRYV
jgi:hypothetical protein